jgi:hypothetical protein
MKKTLVLPLIGIAAMALTSCGGEETYSHSLQISSQTALLSHVGTCIKANLAAGQSIYDFAYGVDFYYPDAAYYWANGNAVLDSNGLVEKYTDNKVKLVGVTLYTEKTLGAGAGDIYYGFTSKPVTDPTDSTLTYDYVFESWGKTSIGDVLNGCDNNAGSVDELKSAVTGDCYRVSVHYASVKTETKDGKTVESTDSNGNLVKDGKYDTEVATAFVVAAKDAKTAGDVEKAKKLVASVAGDCLVAF